LWEEGGQKLEGNSVLDPFRRAAIDALDVKKRVVLLPNSWRSNSRHDGVSRLQAKLLQLPGRDVNVVGGIEVIVIGGAQKCVALLLDFHDALSLDQSVKIKPVLFGFREEWIATISIVPVVPIVSVMAIAAVAAVVAVVSWPSILSLSTISGIVAISSISEFV
jgi:hypothetical protein